VYIENQAFAVPEVAGALDGALERGVEVVVLVPPEPEDRARAARARPELLALGRHSRFALVGIAGRSADGARHDVYVHAKVMLVDDTWATIGSCNLHAFSVLGNTEMNATFQDPAAVRALRCELLSEHLGRDTSDLDDRAALAEYRRIAVDNRRRRDAGDPEWEGLAFSLDPAAYGR
jgi:phosphatidylserine/phosphatidylglycerophosphate/cardiolipin synthase-like enzyme